MSVYLRCTFFSCSYCSFLQSHEMECEIGTYLRPPSSPRITLQCLYGFVITGQLTETREQACYGLWGATNEHAMVGERLCCGWGASPSWMGSCDHLRPCPRQGPSTINVFQRVAMPSLVPSLVGCKALKMGVKAAVLIIRQCLST